MFDHITGYNVWVDDQDQALEFYVGKLGFEVVADVDLGFMRWLTVSLPGQPAPNLVLCPLSLARLEPAEVAQARSLRAKGVLGTVFVAVKDCQAEHDRLLAAGATVTQPPTQQAYGIDCAVADPSGNQVRIAQLAVRAEEPAPAVAGS